MRIITFGLLVDVLGNNIIEIEDELNTQDLITSLHKRYPQLAAHPYSIAVDKKIIHASTPLNKYSEIALLPPFSGG